MTWRSTVPDALDALVALAEQLKDAQTAAYDGPEVKGSRKRRAIIVGYDTEQASAVEHQFEEGGYSPNQPESYRVLCRVEVGTGSAIRLSAARVDAYDLFGQFAALIYADATLGGVVMTAQIGEAAYSPSQSAGAAVAVVHFGIDCEGFTGH